MFWTAVADLKSPENAGMIVRILEAKYVVGPEERPPSIEPSNKPLERPDVSAQADVDRASASGSAPSRSAN